VDPVGHGRGGVRGDEERHRRIRLPGAPVRDGSV
jgi:hypothetical protein